MSDWDTPTFKRSLMAEDKLRGLTKQQIENRRQVIYYAQRIFGFGEDTFWLTLPRKFLNNSAPIAVATGTQEGFEQVKNLLKYATVERRWLPEYLLKEILEW